MGEPDRTDAARLQELASVTKEYAIYSRMGVGIPLVVFGAWFLVAALVGAAASTGWAMVAFVAAPAVWLLAARAMRRHYQRHGVVTAPDDDLGFGKSGGVWGGWAAAALLLESFAFVIDGWRWAAAGAPSRWAGLAFGIVGLLFAAWAAPRWTRDTRSGFSVLAVAMMTLPVVLVWRDLDSWLAREYGLVVVSAGVVFAAAGLTQHLRYRRLERRLAALRGSA